MPTRHSRPFRLTATAVTATAVVGLATACSAPVSAPVSVPVSAPAPAASSSADQTPPADRCQGGGIDHSAAITASHDVHIDAPLDHVWNTQTDVERWPQWQDAVASSERLDPGPLDTASQFRWTTPVPASQFSPADTLTITSSVEHVEPHRCILWRGPAIGETVRIDEGTHLWTFSESDGGTLVHTEESWNAAALDALQGADADAAQEMLGEGLVVWLQQLEAEAEATA